jgi:hypothetical protein
VQGAFSVVHTSFNTSGADTSVIGNCQGGETYVRLFYLVDNGALADLNVTLTTSTAFRFQASYYV